MLLDDLHAKKGVIEKLSREFGAEHIRVFGSVARCEETPDSDIDLLVNLPRGYDVFRQRIALMEHLRELLGRKVDLIPEHELNPYMRDRILAEAVEL